MFFYPCLFPVKCIYILSADNSNNEKNKFQESFYIYVTPPSALCLTPPLNKGGEFLVTILAPPDKGVMFSLNKSLKLS